MSRNLGVLLGAFIYVLQHLSKCMFNKSTNKVKRKTNIKVSLPHGINTESFLFYYECTDVNHAKSKQCTYHETVRLLRIFGLIYRDKYCIFLAPFYV
jgi:hypothetical protein